MRTKGSEFVGRGLFVGAMACGLCWPMVWNRCALVMPDSSGYLENWAKGDVLDIRPSGYPYFLGPLAETGWVGAACAAQALIVAMCLMVVLRDVIGLRWREAAGVCVVVLGVTTLPWWCSTLMSDVFFAAGALALVGLLSRRVGPGGQAMLWLVLLVSTTMHLALTASMGVMVAFVAVWELLRERRVSWCTGGLVVAVVSGAMVFPTLNRLQGRKFVASTGTYKFIAARMLGDGSLGRRDLVREMAEAHAAPAVRTEVLRRYDLVKGRPNDLVQGFFMQESFETAIFLHDVSLSPLAIWEEHPELPTYRALVVRTMLRKPGTQMRDVAQGAGRLLELSGLPTFWDHGSYYVSRFQDELKAVSPRQTDTFLKGRQQADDIGTAKWNRVITPAWWVGAAIVAAFGLASGWRRKITRAGRAAVTLVAFLVIHAVTTYTLSGNFPRYESRLSWIGVFAAAVLIGEAWMRKARQRRTAAANR